MDLYRYLYSVTGTREDAEDLTQNTFLRALQGIHTYRPELGSPRTWLLAIAHNCWVDWLRSKKERERLLERVQTPASEAGEALEAANVRLALRQLPPAMASAVVLHFILHYTLGEIAEVAGCPVGTVKWRLWSARRRTTTVFDGAGRAIAAVDGGGFRTTTAYDAVGRRESVLNARGYRTSMLYDGASRLEATLNARADRTTTVFDAAGQSIAWVDGNSQRTSASYDPVGRRISRTDALGWVRTWGFDSVGELVQTTDGKAQIATMSYDGRGERTETVYVDGTRITMAFDARGQMTEARDGSGITTQTWDVRGLLSTVGAPSHPNGAPLTYGFDARGLRTQMALGTARHTWTFDAIARNTVYADPDGGRTTWSWNGANEITEQANWNGTATTWTYESRGLVSGIRHRKSDGSELGVDLYAYDANANPVLKVTLGGRNTWEYDALDQLTSEQHELGLVATWQYDPARNRLQQDRTQSGARTVTNYEYDAADRTRRITEGTAVTTLTFDSNGNQTGELSAAGRVTFVWNPRDLLSGYVQPDAKLATFAYRFDNLRESIDPGDGAAATRLVWDSSGLSGYPDILAEVSSGSTVRQYWRGARLLSYKDLAGKGVYQFDHLGNTERLTDAAQSLLAAYRVSAWGEALTTTGSLTGQPFQYGGEWGAYRDQLSGDLWMRARVMDPTAARFLSPDPLLEATGLYHYVGNHALSWVDPSGLLTIEEICEAIVKLINEARDVVVRRFVELREDKLDLYNTRPTGVASRTWALERSAPATSVAQNWSALRRSSVRHRSAPCARSAAHETEHFSLVPGAGTCSR
jgi:RNA polymerase sigma factor (sigma-70 family)